MGTKFLPFVSMENKCIKLQKKFQGKGEGRGGCVMAIGGMYAPGYML